MSRLVTCLDCPMYQTGGYCRHKRKEVSALQPACEHAKTMNQKFNPEDEEAMHITAAATPVASNTNTKTCNKCGRELPLEAFGRHARTKDGLQPTCKECINAQMQAARAARHYDKPEPTPAPVLAEGLKTELQSVVVRETLTDEQMVMALRAHGWTVTCTRTITQEL